MAFDNSEAGPLKTDRPDAENLDDLASQYDRRRLAAHRLVPLECGCRDPWICPHGRQERVSDNALAGWERAARHLAALGLPSRVPGAVRAAMRHRALVCCLTHTPDERLPSPAELEQTG